MLMLYQHEIKLSEETWKKALDKTQGANKIALNKQKHTPHHLTYSLPKPARPQLPFADYLYYKYIIVRTIIQF